MAASMSTWTYGGQPIRRRRGDRTPIREIRARGPLVEQFVERIKTKDGRRVLFAALLGKVVALIIIGLLIKLTMVLVGGVAGAQEAPPPAFPVSGDAQVSATNTAWTLVAAFLVFFMQAGFMMLEAGFARERETVNVLLECVVDTCLCGLLFWAWGFAWMFGGTLNADGSVTNGGPLIGNDWYFVGSSPTPAVYPGTSVAFFAFWLFQYAFADTCSTITSGAMVGRTGFAGDLLYSFGVSGFLYPILGHWAWGPGGFLGTGTYLGMSVPFRDFAGSTVVHTVGGMIALAGAIALGPRLGRRFKRDGGAMPAGHSMVLALVGGVVLWFGWYGFNPGSTLSALDSGGIGRVAMNTTLAASAGGLATLFVLYARVRSWDPGMTTNGFLAGLVAITAPCYWVNSVGAVLIGAVAGVAVVFFVDFIEWLRVDDPVGAVAVHGGCGILGTLAVGLLATGDFGVPTAVGMDTSTVAPVKGLFYGGGFAQLQSQITGSVIVTACALLGGLGLMYLVKLTKTLRVSREGELEGLDVHEHGGPAYHYELGASGYTVPTAETGHTAAPSPVTR